MHHFQCVLHGARLLLLTLPSQQHWGILLTKAVILIKGNISHWRLEPLVLKLNARC